MKTRIKLHITERELLERLKMYVDTKSHVKSVFNNKVGKSFYGLIEDNVFNIKNTPVLFKGATTIILGKVSRGSLEYEARLNYRILFLTLGLLSVFVSVVLFYLGHFFYFGGYLGVFLLIYGSHLLSLRYNYKCFNDIIEEINR